MLIRSLANPKVLRAQTLIALLWFSTDAMESLKQEMCMVTVLILQTVLTSAQKGRVLDLKLLAFVLAMLLSQLTSPAARTAENQLSL